MKVLGLIKIMLLLIISSTGLFGQQSQRKDSCLIRYEEIIKTNQYRCRLPMYQYLVINNNKFCWYRTGTYKGEYSLYKEFWYNMNNDTIWINYKNEHTNELEKHPQFSTLKKDTMPFLKEYSLEMKDKTIHGFSYHKNDTIIKVNGTLYSCYCFVREVYYRGYLEKKETFCFEKKSFKPIFINYDYFLDGKRAKGIHQFRIDGEGMKKNPSWAKMKILYRKPKKRKK